MNSLLSQLVSLGYDVELATPSYTSGDTLVPAAYNVRGYGISVYVSSADDATIESLLDPDAHAARVEAFENPTVDVIEELPTIQSQVAAALQSLPEGPLQKGDLAGVIAALLGG